jgi:hypothetical protein
MIRDIGLFIVAFFLPPLAVCKYHCACTRLAPTRFEKTMLIDSPPRRYLFFYTVFSYSKGCL